MNKDTSELYAAIDMGSNSFHMLVIRLNNGHVQILNKIKQKVRLAEGLSKDNILDNTSIERGLACLRTFAERLQDIPAENVKVVATATLRLATNRDDFIYPAEQILGGPIAVISGLEEARQIYMGVAYTSSQDHPRLVIDIGGASTELIVGKGTEPTELDSLNMGCVTFAGNYFKNGILSRENFTAGLNAARQLIQPVAERFKKQGWQHVLGASGTPQAVSEILLAQQVNDSIRLNYLYELMELCIACKTLDSLVIDGLTDDRKAIFHSGLTILIALFEVLDISEMQLSGGALREGLLYGMLEQREQRSIQYDGLSVVMEHFHIDQAHAEHVAGVALMLYRQCSSQQIDGEAILHGAAMLHEIGLHIDYKNAHQHGEYLLRHITLNGYTQLQQRCIRDLVALHRHTLPEQPLGKYQLQMREQLQLLLRVLRIAIAFSVRRENLRLPKIEITRQQDILLIRCPDQWLSKNLLVYAQLQHEKWLQHQIGFQLEIQ